MTVFDETSTYVQLEDFSYLNYCLSETD